MSHWVYINIVTLGGTQKVDFGPKNDSVLNFVLLSV